MIGDFVNQDYEKFVVPVGGLPIYGSDHRGHYFKRDVDGGLLTGNMRWREITKEEFYEHVYKK